MNGYDIEAIDFGLIHCFDPDNNLNGEGYYEVYDIYSNEFMGIVDDDIIPYDENDEIDINKLNKRLAEELC